MKYVNHSLLMNAAMALAATAALATAQPTNLEPLRQAPKPAVAIGMHPIQPSKTTVDLKLPVTGLTEKNSDEVKSSLERLTRYVYECPQCKQQYSRYGECPDCKVALSDKKENLLERVTPVVGLNTIEVASTPGVEVRLSAIESALRSHAVTLEREKMTIPGDATLVLSGPASLDDAKSIQSALEDAKLFQNAQVQKEQYHTVVHVTARAVAPERDKVEKALSKAGAGVRITDLIWNDWTA